MFVLESNTHKCNKIHNFISLWGETMWHVVPQNTKLVMQNDACNAISLQRASKDGFVLNMLNMITKVSQWN